ncbi:DUF317 domain-containing protein [Streptomyces sp. NBC_00024]|uniref:DUF317 domain-containing protein n=1 Tax=Streptomyces sp. NBC_00024 TaxID=2903612 RepID=UPI0038693C8E
MEPDLDGQWWTLSHAAEPDRPAWYASVGARTPVELIAAVTDTLTDPASTASAPSDPYEPLRQIGWSPYGDDGLVSPDKAAYLERLGTPEIREPGSPPSRSACIRRCGRPVSASTLPRAWSPRSPTRSPIRPP